MAGNVRSSYDTYQMNTERQ